MTILDKIQLFSTELVYNITTEINLPIILCLFIELCSNIQILSLSLLPFLDGIPTSQNTLSAAINYILSYLEPFKIFNPFSSEASIVTILILCSLYFALYITIIGYIALNRKEKNPFKEAVCKVASFMTMIHSKIIFYFIHCFVLKAITCSYPGSLNCSTAIGVTISSIILVLNAIITLFHEVCCYRIHQNNHAYGIKNNPHNFVRFAHKLFVIILFSCFEDSAKILVLFNISFNLFDLLALHYRLPFYNLKMLKFSIACSTASAFCSIMTIYRFFNTGENICLVMIPVLSLAIKMSIMKLNQTLQNIFCFRFRTPYHAAHLPNLVQDYLNKQVTFPAPEKFSRSTIYSMGFLGSEVEKILLTRKDQNPQTTTQEVRRAAYSKVLEIMTRALQRYPKSEILLLSIAQIYLQVFGDSFKALDIVNRIPEKHQSFAGRVSVKAISNDFADMHQEADQLGSQQEKRKNSHLSYFAYKSKIQFFKGRIRLEIQGHLKLWKTFSLHESDVFTAVTQASRISSHTREITNYWYKNFEGQEFSYVNASLMYGLYLEIVQAIPSGGYALTA